MPRALATPRKANKNKWSYQLISMIKVYHETSNKHHCSVDFQAIIHEHFSLGFSYLLSSEFFTAPFIRTYILKSNRNLLTQFNYQAIYWHSRASTCRILCCQSWEYFPMSFNEIPVQKCFLTIASILTE